MIVDRRRNVPAIPVLPSLSVEVACPRDAGRRIPATVDRLTAGTVVVTFESGVDALAVATAASLELTFRGPGLEVTVGGRPGHRAGDIHGSRSVEVVLDDRGRKAVLGT